MEIAMKFLDLSPGRTSAPNFSNSDSLISLLQRDINKLFKTFSSKSKGDSSLDKSISFIPSLDIVENKDEYRLHVELAGIPKKILTFKLTNTP